MDETRVDERLVRRVDRRWVAGVAGGLADHFGVGAGWVRAGFVLASFFGGLGIAAYLLLWVVVPRADRAESAAQMAGARFPDAPAWIGIGLIGLGLLSLVGHLGIHLGGIGWALFLIGGGFLLFQREDGAGRRVQAVMPAPPPATTPAGPATAAMALTAPIPASGVVSAPPPPVVAVRAPRERSPLGWLVLGLALAASGLVGVLRNAGVMHLTLAQTVAIPLTIIGLGLLVGTLIGRARWTILLGLLLIPFVFAASVFTVPLNGRWGETNISRLSQVRSSYTQSGGRFVLELDRMDPANLPPTITVTMAAGTVEVAIPPQGVRVEGTVNVGQVRLGSEHDGTDVRGTLGAPRATTVVKVHVDAGQVTGFVVAHPLGGGK